MNRNPTTSLKWSATVCAVLWTGWMVWLIGSFDLVPIAIFSIAGTVFGLCWYVAMRFVLVRVRPSDDGRAGVVDALHGRLYPWLVWAALMVLTGIVTAGLLDLVSPLLPAGDWHWLISSMFVILVWPALMWSLRPWMKRHLPA